MVSGIFGFGNKGPLYAARSGGAGGGGGARASSAFKKKTIYDISGDFTNKKVLIRCDFNGTSKNMKLADTGRIDAALPSILYALRFGASQVFLMSHNGRNAQILERGQEHFSLAPLDNYLSNKLYEDVHFVARLGNAHRSRARVILLENTREDARDEANDKSYAREIMDAVRPDIYVLDGFSVAHRDQASVTWPAKIMKEQGKPAVAGALLQKEYEFLVERVIKDPARPFLVFLGGAKVDTKMPTLKALLPNVNTIVLGGGMVFPFLLEQGYDVLQIDPFGGKEGREEELRKERVMARSILDSEYADRLILPNLMVGPDRKVVDLLTDALPEQAYPMKDTLITNLTNKMIAVGYRTIFFNGAFGAFEEKLGGYAEGTNQVFRFMDERTAKGILTIPGGGDTMNALKELRKSEKVSFGFETTGGGASGDLLALGFDGRAEELPGFACLTDK